MATCPSGHTSATDDYCDVCGAAIAEPTPTPASGSASAAPASAGAATESRPEETCAACGAPRVGRFCEECGHDSLSPTPPRIAAPQPSTASAASPGQSPPGQAPPTQPPALSSGQPPAPAPSPAPEVSYPGGTMSPGALQPGMSYPRGTMEAGAGGRARAAWHVTVEADRAYYDRVVAEGGPDATALDFPPFCPPRRFDLVGPQVTIGRRSRSRGIFPTVDLVGPPEDPGVSHSHALLVPTSDGWSVVDLASTNGTTVNDDPEPLRPNTPRPLTDGDRIHVGAWTTITLHRTA